MTLIAPAPKAEAEACRNYSRCSRSDAGCVVCGMLENAHAKTATGGKGPLRCGNNGCKTPLQNVAMRWCQGKDNDGRKTGATLEASCEPCHLLDELDFAVPSSGEPYEGPERLARPRLAHSFGVEDPALEDC